MTKYWRGQDAIISITDASDNNVPVGVLQDVEVNPEKETEELRGSGSIERQDVQQYELNVSVTGTVAEWDLDTWKSITGYNSTSEKIEDTSDIPLFDVDVDIQSSDSSTADTVRVRDVYFSDLPVGGSRDDYLEMDLEGNGRTAKINPA